MVHSSAVFTLVSISLFCHSRPVMHCNPSSGLAQRKAVQLHYSGHSEWKVLWLACSPITGQYFHRLCDCSASLKICLHFPSHPSRPKRGSLHCLSCPVSHNVDPPSVSNHLANFSQRSSSMLL